MRSTRMRALVASVGFACFLAMDSFSLWGLTLLTETALGAQAASLWTHSLSLANSFSFFFFALGAWKAPNIFDRDPLPAAITFIALGIIFLNGYLTMAALALAAAGGAFMGLGTTCCFFCWARTFQRDGIRSAKIEIVLGSAISIVPFLAFLTLDVSTIVFTLSLLALLNLFALYSHRFLSQQKGKEPKNKSAYDTESPESVSAFMGRTWKSLLCVTMVGIMAPVFAALYPSPTDALGFAQQAFAIHAENLCAVIILGFIWFVLKRDISIVSSFTLLYPIMTTALLLFPVLGGIAYEIAPYIGGIAFVVLSMVTMMESVSNSIDLRTNLTIEYGVKGGVLYSSYQLGNLAVEAMSNTVLIEDITVLGVMFVLLYGCSIVLFFVTRETPESQIRNDTARQANGSVSDTKGTGSSTRKNDELSTCTLTDEHITGVANPAHKITEVANTPQECPSASDAASSETKKEDSSHDETSSAAYIDTKQEDNEKLPSSDADKSKDPIDAACQEIIEQHSLSKRQAEVLVYLAHGYDIPTIAKKLYLSENTIRTHVKKIYSELGIHGKQELIEMVNAPHKQS